MEIILVQLANKRRKVGVPKRLRSDEGEKKRMYAFGQQPQELDAMRERNSQYASCELIHILKPEAEVLDGGQNSACEIPSKLAYLDKKAITLRTPSHHFLIRIVLQHSTQHASSMIEKSSTQGTMGKGREQKTNKSF